MKNSLYPFFWQHGEDHQVLETYMEKISESGMGGVCIEARPHPEFVKEGFRLYYKQSKRIVYEAVDFG